MKYKFGILKNENKNSHKKWENACKHYQLDYTIIDLTKCNWLEKIQNQEFDCFLLQPPGVIARFKNLYDERLYILCKILGYKTFPSYEEVVLHENKKLLSYFLNAKKIPHPNTFVFYFKKEALEFLLRTNYPLVGKSSNGAGGTGVKILKNYKDAKKYVQRAFSDKGLTKKSGPNFKTGNIPKRVLKKLANIKEAREKIKSYIDIASDAQKGFVILQEYVPHDFEWRSVRIGDSYFAHKKIKQGDMASGTKGIDYINPPEALLDFTKKICEENNFNFMAIDLFENQNGGYLVNELQTIFGHVQDYILEVDGQPGRYLYINNQWQFEKGDFNSNESYNLRLKFVIQLLKNNQPWS